MCMAAGGGGGGQSAEALKEQLNKGNASLSVQKVAGTTEEKKSTKRQVGSLRVPLKASEGTTTGVNTAEVTAGLNIPV